MQTVQWTFREEEAIKGNINFKCEENPTKPTNQSKAKPKHTIDSFENHTRAKKVIRKGIIRWHMTWLVHELLEKKKDVDNRVKRKWMREKVEEMIHTGKNRKKQSNTRELFSHFLSRHRDSNNLRQDMTPPWDAISVTAYLHNCDFSPDFFTSGKMAWKGGSLLLQASCAPQKKKHHTESRKVTFKVHNKHDYNLPPRCLPTSPPTWKMYVPFEIKFPW